MVLLTTTPRILSATASLPQPSLSTLYPSSHDDALPAAPGAPMSHTTLIRLSRLLKSSSSPTRYTLNDLLRSAHPYTPPPPPRAEKTVEYEALMSRLRAEQECREYLSLTSKNTTSSFGTVQESFADQEKDDVTPSLVFNVLLSVVMCGVATFHITRFWKNDGLRVLVSIMVAIVVGVAEVVVYAGYLRKVKESREKERRTRERKEVVGSEEITSRGSGDGTAIEEKDREEIWGRGKHGGVRRRIRDKWEKEQEQQDGS